MHSRLPALWAFLAVLLWSSLAMTAELLRALPPFLQLAVAFSLGGLPVLWKGRQAFPRWRTLLLGVSGFYFYHFFLFSAFRLAPPVEANLINYLWPMLMVLLAPLFAQEFQLKKAHCIGAALALSGVVILMVNSRASFSPESLLGFGLAFLAALTWPSYSLLVKKTTPEKLVTIAGICLITGGLCALTHLWLEPKVVPTVQQWWGLCWLGVGPFGAAFYLWDLAVRNGDPRTVGALSYLTPVLSTILLVFGAGAESSVSIWLAMALMTLGSMVGALSGTK